MPREGYQERLADLRRDVVEMADLVLERYEMALEAARNGDEVLAARVVEGDHEINDRYLELEGECTELLALQQPVASDLRFVTASFKIITDLERVADLATNLAGHGQPGTEGIHPAVDLDHLGSTAGEMVADAIEAYETADPEACRAVAARDDELDRACERASEAIVRELLALGVADDDAAAEAAVADASRGLLTVRDVERVGDHAVNVSARALYMAENDDELIY